MDQSRHGSQFWLHWSHNKRSNRRSLQPTPTNSNAGLPASMSRSGPPNPYAGAPLCAPGGAHCQFVTFFPPPTPPLCEGRGNLSRSSPPEDLEYLNNNPDGIIFTKDSCIKDELPENKNRN